MRKINKKIKILMAAAEAAPIVKVGGLADVVGSLPKALSRLGCDVRLIIPGYRQINKRKFGFKKNFSGLSAQSGVEKIKFNLWESKKAISGAVVYLLEDNKYFTERSVYKKNSPADFLFFSLMVLKCLDFIKWKPNIIHCHDFHTAFIPALLKSDEFLKLKDIKTLFTIHNLRYQGKSAPKILKAANLDKKSLASLKSDISDGDVNFMVQGIVNADLINTVSPNYAREIFKKEYAEGLSGVLTGNKKKIFGILNGVDIDFFNPKKDRFIRAKYDNQSLSKKRENKIYLQKKLGLKVNSSLAVAGFVGRLCGQKGINLFTREVAELPCQFVFLGTGEKKYERYLKKLAQSYPGKVSANLFFDVALAQQIYAGADIILLPSEFEPCGLVQMIAMRYGTIPVARNTGGLADTINSKTGFKFKNFSSFDFKIAIKNALKIYYNYPKKWLKLQENCFNKNFSWTLSAKKYLTIYKKLAINKKNE